MQFEPISWGSLAWAAAIMCGFTAVLFLASIALPGAEHYGSPDVTGARVKYKLNGLLLFALSFAVALTANYLGLFSLAILARRLPALLVAANILATAATFALTSPQLRTPADFFYGTAANPALAGVDLKMFSYRPSLIGLGLLNVSLACIQHQQYGSVSPRMMLYQVLYFGYLANYFQFESGMLFTWDVVSEKFGWMLVWGDYVLVPFFYCLPGIFLVNNRNPLSPAEAILLAAIYLAGFWLFRGANQQKHKFKSDPQSKIWGRPARSLDGRLLISGFWGIGRKLNYTGEIMLYCSWTLLCGLSSPWPYLLPLWLMCLLPHRAWRDERRCRAKYGLLWDRYCAHARFRMLPFLY